MASSSFSCSSSSPSFLLVHLFLLLSLAPVSSQRLVRRNPSAAKSQILARPLLHRPDYSRNSETNVWNGEHQQGIAVGGIMTGGRSTRRRGLIPPKAMLGKLKEVFSEYGPVALAFHSSIWTLTLATSYLLVANDLPLEQYLPYELQQKMPSEWR